MIKKHKINDITLTKEEIKKLTDKQFIKEWEKGNIAVEDFLEFMKRPKTFSQAEVFKRSMMMLDEREKREQREQVKNVE